MSSFTLRLLALALMCVDHAGLALFPALPAFRWIGRLAFPLYCFLIAQGYAHTRDLRAYARRLLLFALISEIPFDLLIFGRLACNVEQNALFSLLLGLLALFAADSLRERPLLCAASQLLLCMLAMFTRVSYGWLGVALCLCFHLLKERRGAMLLAAAGALLLYTLSLFFAGVQTGWALASLFALCALPLIALYNGRRGPRALPLTALFYAAYPAHLLLLYALRVSRIVPPYLFR